MIWIAIGGIGIGIGLWTISKAIHRSNDIKEHEMFLKKYHYMD